MNRRIFLHKSMQAAAACLPAKAQIQRSEGPLEDQEPVDLSSLRLCIVTMKGAPWKLEDNFCRMEYWVRKGAKLGAKLVITPESILDGYVCCTDRQTTKEKMLAIAQSVPGGVTLPGPGR
jgi:hypothetical protein